MFTTYIKNLNDMVFPTVSPLVISTSACLCYALECMAILKNVYVQLVLIPKLALALFVHW